MRRAAKPLIPWLATLVVLCCVAPLSAEPAVDAELAEVRKRLQELSGKYADAAEDQSASPTEAANSSLVQVEASGGGESQPVAEIEQTPLGQGFGGRVGEAGERADGSNWVLSTFAALGCVIGLILAARWAYSKLGGQPISRPSRAVEVLSRTAVAPKNHVLLLRVGRRVLVVGDSTTGLRTLANLDDDEEVAALMQSVEAEKPQSVSASFNSLLNRFNGPYDRDIPEGEGLDRSEARIDHARDALAGLASRVRTLGGKGGAA